jgi:hypothetical protein
MASEIHKKRTGKGFKVSEEIVIKEEMYEEEDDELPRHFRALAAHLQTSSPELNSRVNAYLTNQVALATLARAKEVDRMFAQHFPQAAAMGQQLQQSVYFQGLQTDTMGTPAPPAARPYSGASHTPTPASYANGRSQSTARPSPMSSRHNSADSSYVHSPSSQVLSDDHSSPPILSPGPGSIDSSTSTPLFSFAQHAGHIAPPALFQGQGQAEAPMHQSSFTSELSQEAKLFGGFDPNDPLTGHFYGMPDGMMGSVGDMTHFDNVLDDTSYLKPQPHQQQQPQHTSMPANGDYFQPFQPTSKQLNIPGQDSRIGTPGGGEGDPWNLWVNDNDDPYAYDPTDVKQEQHAA